MARAKKCPRCAETVKGDARICRFCSHQFPALATGARSQAKKCFSCGGFSKSGARTCEHCSTQYPAAKPSQVVGGFLVLLALGGIFVAAASSLSPHHADIAESTGGPAASEAANDDKAAEFGALAIASLRRSLRDPDSLKVEDVSASQDGTVACLTYRAHNGFGGMNKDTVVFTKVGGDTSARAWNRLCAGKELSNVTRNALTMEGFIPKSN